MALELRRRRFTVDEYYRMARAGVLGEDDRVELIEGEILEMVPIGVRHAYCVDRLNELFVRTFSDAAWVRVQNPLRLDKRSEPQPDVMLLRRKRGGYASRHPAPGDVLLLVEVSDSSADPDRRVKVPLYARFGIAEVWLVDLEQGTITAYSDPGQEGYRTARIVRSDERLAPLAFPNRAVPVGEVLPK